MNRNEEIGQKIRLARVAANLTQEGLGKKIGYSAMGISYLEKGTRSIKLSDLSKIADVLGVTEYYLLEPSLNSSAPTADFSRSATEDGNRDADAEDAINKFKQFLKDK